MPLAPPVISATLFLISMDMFVPSMMANSAATHQMLPAWRRNRHYQQTDIKNPSDWGWDF